MTKRRPLFLALAVTAASTLLVVLALVTASGVTKIGPTSYHTEFADTGWWASGFLLVVPVGVASGWCPRFAALFVTGALVPQWILPGLAIHRADAAGWGDPLSVFGFAYPILMTLLFGVVAAVAAVVAMGARRPTPAAAP